MAGHARRVRERIVEDAKLARPPGWGKHKNMYCRHNVTTKYTTWDVGCRT